MTDHSEAGSSDDHRSRIVQAAATLIAAGGREAATTRAVAAAAAVQAPTIYRLFGDKEGLLDAVAEWTLANFVASKARSNPSADPVEDLREGWDTYIAFGLANPAVFALMNTNPGRQSKATIKGLSVLRERVRRVALTGRLRVPEGRAVDLIHAIGTGTVLTLLAKSPEDRAGLSDDARAAAYAQVLGDRPSSRKRGLTGMASALRAGLDDIDGLSAGERQLLAELLDRIARQP